MDLLNEQVKHEMFGKGSVVGCTDLYIEVDFPEGRKKFVFPDALGEHLVLANQKIAARVASLKKKVLKVRKKEQLQLEKKRIQDYEKQQRLLERERLMRNHRLTPVSQAVFWVDGQEQDRVFADWRIFTSVRKSGALEGKPNRLVRLHQNSGCLITAREAGQRERKRRILGVFMVEENFIGKLCEDGYIPAHSKFRVRLSPEESEQMLFWNYYFNRRYPSNMTWNSGRHRYFDNVWMAQILNDLARLKKGTPEEQLMQDFLEHFVYLNQLDLAELPVPDGALIRLESSRNGTA